MRTAAQQAVQATPCHASGQSLHHNAQLALHSFISDHRYSPGAQIVGSQVEYAQHAQLVAARWPWRSSWPAGCPQL